MKRDIIKQLLEWKDSSPLKPLLLTGVRQCGKTFVLKEFGNKYFTNCVYINFESDDKYCSLFNNDLNPTRIIRDLQILGHEISAGKTLIIFDEIQACPRAITSLKYFAEQTPDLHIVAAGSLLGVAINREGFSFPVGKVDRLSLYPMSFREFVVASGKEMLLEAISEDYALEQNLPQHFSEILESLLLEYYVVGGMPECVKVWTETHDIKKVEKIQNNILTDYQSDFAKHAPKSDIQKLFWIWDSVPVQLAKENNKFVFSHVKQGKRSAELEDALHWLIDAGLIHRLTLVENIELPLSFFSDDTYFKVYMSDIGLMRQKIGLSAESVWNQSERYLTFKGAFTENFVMNELIKNGIHPYFWRSKNSAELDFLFEDKDRIIPLEAKSSTNTKAKTYSSFCKRFSPTVGFKVSMKNVGLNQVENTQTYSLPLYMLWRLGEYLGEIDAPLHFHDY